MFYTRVNPVYTRVTCQDQSLSTASNAELLSTTVGAATATVATTKAGTATAAKATATVVTTGVAALRGLLRSWYCEGSFVQVFG